MTGVSHGRDGENWLRLTVVLVALPGFGAESVGVKGRVRITPRVFDLHCLSVDGRREGFLEVGKTGRWPCSQSMLKITCCVTLSPSLLFISLKKRRAQSRKLSLTYFCIPLMEFRNELS